MAPSNLSFVLHPKVDDLRFEERPPVDRKSLGPDDVIVAPKKTGICGSDVHYVKHLAIGDFVVKEPMVLGHESAGIIKEVGSAVKHLKVGDEVALEPGATCRKCVFCKGGQYEHCPDMRFAATPPYDGSLCGEYLLPGDLCYKLPKKVSLEEGAMIEPLSVGVNALAKVAEMKPNQNVCVFGAGPVGLLTMAAAKALGARRVIAVDIQPDRLKFAKSYSATDTFAPGKPKDDESKTDYSAREAERMRKELALEEGGVEGLDIVVECSGAETCVQIGLMVLKTRGKLVQVGMGNPSPQIPMSTLLSKGLSLLGSFRYGAGVYPLAIDLVSQGKISLGPLITHRYAFKDAVKAFEHTAAGKGGDGKVLLKAIIDGPEE